MSYDSVLTEKNKNLIANEKHTCSPTTPTSISWLVFASALLTTGNKFLIKNAIDIEKPTMTETHLTQLLRVA